MQAFSDSLEKSTVQVIAQSQNQRQIKIITHTKINSTIRM